MANYNLTNQTISSSFQQLLQKDTDTGNLVDGLGNPIDGVTISGSVSSSFVGDGSGIDNLNPKYATTGSNTFTGANSFNGGIFVNSQYEQYAGDITNYVGRIQAGNHGYVTGGSNFTGSFIGDGSGLTNLPIPTLPSGLVSGSSQIVLEDTTYTDNGDKSFLQTDGAGNLSFQYVKSMYEEIKNREAFEIQRGQALYVDSNTGDRVDVYLADNSNPNRFPATLIASENISANGNGLGLIAGLIDSIDVGTLQSGDIVYLGTNGGWTATRPTGSADIQVLGVVSRPGNNGAGYFINQLHTTLPNITEGNVWVGDVNGVPQQVSTGSFGSSIDTGSFATTGSNTFTGDEIIQGTNTIPSSTLTVKDGNNTPRLQVQNATLAGITGADVVINGNLLNDGDATLTGNQTLLGDINAPSASLIELGSVGKYVDNFNIKAAAYNTVVSNWNHYAINSTNIEAQNILNLKTSGNVIVSGSTSFADDVFVGGTNTIPGSTLDVRDGNNTPRLQVNNATLSGLTGVDVIVNGNQFVAGNISATGSLGIADNKFIISSGSNTVEFVGKFSDGQAGVVFNAPNSKFLSTGNFNIQANGLVAVDAVFGINLNNDTTLDKNGVVNGTNTSPGSTLTVKDGNNTPRLQVQNATLAGLTGADVIVNGNLLNDGDATLTGNQTINGTNAAPGATFQVKDGTGTNKVEVNNATLGGLVGVDVNLNGTVQITETLKMVAQDPLPSGVVGELAVSGSALYFYDGAWRAVSLV